MEGMRGMPPDKNELRRGMQQSTYTYSQTPDIAYIAHCIHGYVYNVFISHDHGDNVSKIHFERFSLNHTVRRRIYP